MRRSSMIDKITEFIWNNIHEYDGHTYSWFAEKLLKEIEDAGMTPPEIERHLTEKEIKLNNENGLSFTNEDVIFTREWEDE